MSLSEFYKTKEWETLRAVIINERVNPSDGFIYCEHCGKPITRAYDLIAHHVIELTETNYTNYEISLNPKNIKLVHHACHNRIHEKAGFKTRKAFIIYGPPFSGKTTYVNQVKNDGDLIVDIDNIWECVSGCKRYVKPKRLNGVVFGIRDALLDMIKYRRGNWNCAYVIGGYALESERERLAGDIGAECILIDTDIKTCFDRFSQQQERGEEWSEFITKWFETYRPPLHTV